MEASSAVMRLRLATTADIADVMAIVQKVVPQMQASGNFQWDESYPCAADFETDVEKSQLWLAVDEKSTVVGFSALTTTQPIEYKDCGYDILIPAIVPHRMAVDPSCRRAGLGQLFLSKAEELASAGGLGLVRIDTNASNHAMQKVILKAGYAFRGEIFLTVLAGKLPFCCYEKTITR